MPVISILEELRLEDCHEFEVNLDYTASSRPSYTTRKSLSPKGKEKKFFSIQEIYIDYKQEGINP